MFEVEIESSNMSRNSDELREVKYTTKTNTTNKNNDQKLQPENYDHTSLFLYFAALSSNLIQLSYGMMVAWISPVSELILSNNTDINPLGEPVTTIQYSILGASQPVGSVIGPLLCGKIFDVFGRKKCLTTICIIMTTSILILAFSRHIIIYCITLFIVGFCTGGVNVGLPVYISEITEDHNRGLLSCLVNIFSPLGTVVTFLIGSYLSIKVFTLTCAIPAAINAICFLTILPESPVQLVLLQNKIGAKTVLQKIRKKNSNEIEREIKKIEYELQETVRSEKTSFSSILSHKRSRNGLIISVIGYVLFVLCGVPAFLAYLQPIFNQAGTNLPSNICALMVAVMSILCYIGASYVVDKWGRRKTILYSVALSTIPLFLNGLYFYLELNTKSSMEKFKWLPILGMMTFITLNVFGTATIPVALMNELFTNQVKATGISIVVFLAGILTSISLFLAPIIMKNLGLAWFFWVFTINCVLGSVLTYLCMPETKGKSILEIQNMLDNLIYV